MSMDNLISIQFTNEELAQIDAALQTLESIFADRLVQLTPSESQRYGKLGNETENWANMIYQDAQTAPTLIPPFINRDEWAKDEMARNQLSSRATRLQNLAQQIMDTNRLIGFDIYQTCLSVYQNVRYLSAQNMPGTKTYYEKWNIQFPGRSRRKNGTTQTQPVLNGQ